METILFLAIFFSFACVSLGVLIGGGYFIIRWWLQSMRATSRQLEDKLGLVNHNTQGFFPDLRGKIEGVDVVVDVLYQRYARSGSSIKSSLRPWTRVQAQLPVPAQVQVRSRHQKLDEKIEWPVRETGDPNFDQKYELFMAEDVALDIALPIAVREALMTANPPVHVVNNAALWTRVKIVRDAELLQNVILSCSRVAAAFENSQTPPQVSGP